MKNKRILITAGSTWVRIDKVRVITNIFGGRTGYYIAQRLCKNGFSVTLLLGPTRFHFSPLGGMNILRFKYFEELNSLVKKELFKKRYIAVIHSAAISDYTPVKVYQGKISSHRNQLNIKCKPTPKIIKEIKRIDKNVFLVQFKLEVGVNTRELLRRAYRSMLRNDADLVVANKLEDIRGKRYKSFVMDREKNTFSIRSHQKLAHFLIKTIKERTELR